MKKPDEIILNFAWRSNISLRGFRAIPVYALQKRIAVFTLFLLFLIYATRLRSDIEYYNGNFVLLAFTFTERWVYRNSLWPFKHWLFEEVKIKVFSGVHDWRNNSSTSKLSRSCPIMQPNLGKDRFMPRDLSVRRVCRKKIFRVSLIFFSATWFFVIKNLIFNFECCHFNI